MDDRAFVKAPESSGEGLATTGAQTLETGCTEEGKRNSFTLPSPKAVQICAENTFSAHASSCGGK